jgi:hypothetical protein
LVNQFKPQRQALAFFFLIPAWGAKGDHSTGEFLQRSDLVGTARQSRGNSDNVRAKRGAQTDAHGSMPRVEVHNTVFGWGTQIE